MKVLLVANVLPPRDLSGAGEQVLQLAWGLQQAGCEVEILGRDQCGARVSKTSFPWHARRAVARRVAEWRPDVVQVHESDGGLVIRDLARRAAGRRPLLVALQQVSYVQERLAVRPLIDGDDSARVVARPAMSERTFRALRAPMHIALGRITARRVDLRLAPSRVTAAEIERDYGVVGVEVVPNVTGAPLDLPAGDELRKSRADEVFGQKPFLLAAGRLRIRKGFEILLRAIATAHGRGRRPRLVIAGDGERRESLSVLARDLGLEASVRFAGRCSRSEIARLRRGATALVVPSTYEGMPLVILEAMGDGVPVIASAVSGIPEVVVDGETGWLVSPERSGALAEALIEAAREPGETRRRGEAGRRRLERRFRPRHAAERWLEALERVGGSAPPVWKNPGK